MKPVCLSLKPFLVLASLIFLFSCGTQTGPPVYDSSHNLIGYYYGYYENLNTQALVQSSTGYYFILKSTGDVVSPNCLITPYNSAAPNTNKSPFGDCTTSKCDTEVLVQSQNVNGCNGFEKMPLPFAFFTTNNNGDVLPISYSSKNHPIGFTLNTQYYNWTPGVDTPYYSYAQPTSTTTGFSFSGYLLSVSSKSFGLPLYSTTINNGTTIHKAGEPNMTPPFTFTSGQYVFAENVPSSHS